MPPWVVRLVTIVGPAGVAYFLVYAMAGGITAPTVCAKWVDTPPAVTLPRDQYPNQPTTTRSCVDYDKQDDTAVVLGVIVAGVVSVGSLVLDNRKGHRPAT